MKFILKGTPPTEFEAWKKQDQPTAWSQLGSNLPKKREKGLVYYSKNQLRTALYIEQKGLCCYCNSKIENDYKTTSIEHVEPRMGDKITERIFDYNNLALSCDNRIEKLNSKDYYCDAKKQENTIDLTPFMTECETEIYFLENGEIKSHTERAKRTINVLNLHHVALDNRREAAIIPYIYSDSTSDNPKDILSKKELKANFDLLLNNHHIEYWSSIVSVLKRYLNL
ncbi:MAG TPA: TIGR02646 family protein [Saprospiraceae bacterium]|nr:TIGR02646 family protein [Saprospiraceae bacterium]